MIYWIELIQRHTENWENNNSHDPFYLIHYGHLWMHIKA
jgi:hypothetical protein